MEQFWGPVEGVSLGPHVGSGKIVGMAWPKLKEPQGDGKSRRILGMEAGENRCGADA